MKPVVPPPPGALQAVQQVQAAVRQQQVGKGKGGCGKVIPGGKGKGGGKGSGPSMSGKGMSMSPVSGKGSGGKGGNMFGKGKPQHSYPSPVNQQPVTQMRPTGIPQPQLVDMQQQNQQRMMMQQQPPQPMGHPPQYGQQGPVPPQANQWHQQAPGSVPSTRFMPSVRGQNVSVGKPQLLQQQLMSPTLSQTNMAQQQPQQTVSPQMMQQQVSIPII